MSNLTSGHQKLQQTFVTIELSVYDLCRIESFIKIEAFAVLRPKLWPKRWQVPTLRSVKNHRRLLSSMNLAPSNFKIYAKFRDKWLSLFLAPCFPFPIPHSPFSFLKIAHKRNLTWLGDKPGRWISKLFDIHCSSNRWRWRLKEELLIVPTKFTSGNEDGWWSLSPR